MGDFEVKDKNSQSNLFRGSSENIKIVEKSSFASTMESIKPKQKKSIRFELDETLTPPPKEFKRLGSQRKTLRSSRCLSVVVTENERKFIENSSPRASQGFVRSMCRFFNGNSPNRISKQTPESPSLSPKKLLNRSNSFSEAVLRNEVNVEDETSSANSSPRSSEETGNKKFKLFRSRSWSLRNRRRSSENSSSSSSLSERCSPSYSVKSQDSGFSDSGAESNKAKESSSASSSDDDIEDPNMTQIPATPREKFYMSLTKVPNGELQLNNSSLSLNSAKKCLSVSAGNIASINEGYRIKRHYDIDGKLASPPALGTAALVAKAAAKKPENMLRNVLDRSVVQDDSTPVFSTPVRASFRAGGRKNRPHTIVVEDDNEETPLKNCSTKRRWSIMTPEVNCNDESKLREVGIQDSLVAVWSRFMGQTDIENSDGSILGPKQLLSPHVGPSPSVTISPDISSNAIIEHDSEDIHRIFKPRPVVNNRNSPVYEWWRDLGLWCEPECMTYLQSKPIKRTSMNAQTVEYENMINSDYSNGTIEILRKYLRASRSVKISFNALKSHWAKGDGAQGCKTIQSLTSHIQEFVYDANFPIGADENHVDSKLNGDWNFPGLRLGVSKNGSPANSITRDSLVEIVLLQQRVVLQMVDRLKLCAHRSQYAPQQTSEIQRVSVSLEKSFGKLVELLLLKEVQILVGEIKSPSSEIGLRSVLNTVIQIGNEGTKELCHLLSSQGGVKALLGLAASSHSKGGDIRILALRGISSICCIVDCIQELENCNGIPIISDILRSRQSSIEDRIETAGVLAQITSPWIENNVRIESLDAYVPDIVSALTNLSKLNNSDETFLLVTAALANLTFMSPSSTHSMVKYRTSQTLVKAVRASPFTTLFAKDQVVTVLANMAADATSRPSVYDEDGMNFLLTMLDTKIAEKGYSPQEKSAAERVIKKAAIAISRLCNDPSCCEEIMNLGGVDRLVDLCKDPIERNFCDGILISCITALKRLKSNSRNGETVINQLNASDLVGPKLMDSFVEYSQNQTNQESYV